MFKYLTDPKLVISASLILGFLFPEPAGFLNPYLVPILVVMMTFSLVEFSKDQEVNFKDKNVWFLFLVNYVLFSGLIVLGTLLMVENVGFQNAFFIFAMMPPAVAVVSFAYLFEGDMETAFSAEIVSYIAAVLIIPLSSFFIWGDSVGLWEVIKTVVYLILVPYVATKVIGWLDKEGKFFNKEVSDLIVNFSLGLVFYVVIGFNKQVFLEQVSSLVVILFMLILVRVVFGVVLNYSLKDRIKDSLRVNYVLFGTFKNGGTAIAITILLFSAEATIPLVLNGIISVFYVILLERLFDKVSSKSGNV